MVMLVGSTVTTKLVCLTQPPIGGGAKHRLDDPETAVQDSRSSNPFCLGEVYMRSAAVTVRYRLALVLDKPNHPTT